jgi:1,4-dihydroxy-2-naphthoate octaprenyltransferase
MKVEARIFLSITAFCLIAAIGYGVWSQLDQGFVEPVGTIGLILTMSLALIVGTYFQFVARRVAQRPEDNPDAEVSDGAGELGFFSPGSYWPVTLALAAALAAFAVAFWQVWLIVVGVVAVLIAIGGLVFEYHIGPNRD